MHLHAAIFVVLTIRELSQLTGSAIILGLFDVAATPAIVTWGLLSFRRVYREPWMPIVAKAIGIAVMYAVVGVAALVVAMMWSTWWA